MQCLPFILTVVVSDFLDFHLITIYQVKMWKRPNDREMLGLGVPVDPGCGLWTVWRCVNAQLVERQMATNMLCRQGKHWQIHPKGLGPCQLEGIGVSSVSVQEAKASVPANVKDISDSGSVLFDTFTFIVHNTKM